MQKNKLYTVCTTMLLSLSLVSTMLNASNQSNLLDEKPFQAKILYAPWRKKYMDSSHKQKSRKHACHFCNVSEEINDDDYFIIKRYKNVLLCMNRYPYNHGHLLIVPFEHQSDISLLSKETAQELMHVAQEAVAALKKTCNCLSFNIGINMGKESGGSIPDHIHLHILPRFADDTDFLSILAGTKLISVDVDTLYKELKKLFTLHGD